MFNNVGKMDKCCGCKLCKYVCKTNAISYVEDSNGFYYPKIDNTKCVNCAMCIKNCPSINNIKNNQPKYIYSYNDKKGKKNSASGGAFRTIATQLLRRGYIVYGAAFNENMKVSHIRIASENDLDKMCNSKYIQSDMENVYASITKDISNDNKILFSGTPCQVSAIKNYFKVQNDNKFVLVDILCRGVPNQFSFDRCIAFEEKKKNIKITSFRFRKRVNGDPHGYEYTYVKNGKSKRKVGHYFEFPFYRCFLEYAILRKECYSCNYSTSNRVSDLTIGDFWGIEKYTNADSNKGISLVMPNTIVGEQILKILNANLNFKINFDEYSFNEALIRPAKLKSTDLRQNFFEHLNDLDSELFEKIVLPSNLSKELRHSKIPYFIKRFYHKIKGIN